MHYIKTFLAGKHHHLLILADKIKTRALELLTEQRALVTMPIRTALDLFGIRLVHQVLQKPDETRSVFKSMHGIGHAFAQGIPNLIGKNFPGAVGTSR